MTNTKISTLINYAIYSVHNKLKQEEVVKITVCSSKDLFDL